VASKWIDVGGAGHAIVIMTGEGTTTGGTTAGTTDETTEEGMSASLAIDLVRHPQEEATDATATVTVTVEDRAIAEMRRRIGIATGSEIEATVEIETLATAIATEI
jgi:hypothetical protein